MNEFCLLLVLFWDASWLLQVTSVSHKLTSSHNSESLHSSVRVKHIACARTHTTQHTQRALWWVKLRVANYSLGKVLPSCSSPALFGKKEKPRGGGLMGGGQQLLSEHPVCPLPRLCTLLVHALCIWTSSQPPPLKLCLLPLLVLSFSLVSQHEGMFFIWIVLISGLGYTHNTTVVVWVL